MEDKAVSRSSRPPSTTFRDKTAVASTPPRRRCRRALFDIGFATAWPRPRPRSTASRAIQQTAGWRWNGCCCGCAGCWRGLAAMPSPVAAIEAATAARPRRFAQEPDGRLAREIYGSSARHGVRFTATLGLRGGVEPRPRSTQSLAGRPDTARGALLVTHKPAVLACTQGQFP